MRKKYIFGKKLYISILTSILVMLTMVATTFAWVGVFANSTFEQFDVNVQASKLLEYSIEISADGENFSSEIHFSDLKKQILTNWGYNVDLLSEKQIDNIFSQLNQDQVTNVPIINDGKITRLGEFKNIFNEVSNKYYKFDLYVSFTKNYDTDFTSNFPFDVYLNSGLLNGTKKQYDLSNSFRYPDDFINPYDQLINSGNFSLPNGYRTIKANELIKDTKVNSSSAARIAFEKYEVVDKGHPEQYSSSSLPKSTIIYQDSYEYPVYDSLNEVYDFGGILPDESNLATMYYNSTEYYYYYYKIKTLSVPESILSTRGVNGSNPDLRLTSNTNHLIDSSNPDEKISNDKMMKITVSFWFEGWDADCFPVINYSPVSINIGFSMVNENVF